MFFNFFFLFKEGSNQKMLATIYKMSPVPSIGQSIDSLDSTSHGQLEVLASLGAEDQEVAKFLWQPNDGNKVVTVNTDSRINVWDFSSEGRVQVLSFTYLVQFKSKSNFECLE
jgi:hypothetical protein